MLEVKEVTIIMTLIIKQAYLPAVRLVAPLPNVNVLFVCSSVHLSAPESIRIVTVNEFLVDNY